MSKSGTGRRWRRDAHLSPDEQAVVRAARKQKKLQRTVRSVPAQMDHGSGKRKLARQGEEYMKRERGNTLANLRTEATEEGETGDAS